MALVLQYIKLAQAFEIVTPELVAERLAEDRMNTYAARQAIVEAVHLQEIGWQARFLTAVRALKLGPCLGL